MILLGPVQNPNSNPGERLRTKLRYWEHFRRKACMQMLLYLPVTFPEWHKRTMRKTNDIIRQNSMSSFCVYKVLYISAENSPTISPKKWPLGLAFVLIGHIIAEKRGNFFKKIHRIFLVKATNKNASIHEDLVVYIRRKWERPARRCCGVGGGGVRRSGVVSGSRRDHHWHPSRHRRGCVFWHRGWRRAQIYARKIWAHLLCCQCWFFSSNWTARKGEQTVLGHILN